MAEKMAKALVKEAIEAPVQTGVIMACPFSSLMLHQHSACDLAPLEGRLFHRRGRAVH
jgi:hypothetical protein